MANARADEGVLFWLEVKRNIGAVQLVLNPTRMITARSDYDKYKKVRLEICVCPNSIVVRRFCGEKCVDCIPSSTVPREVNILLKGKDVCDSWIIMRFSHSVELTTDL